MGKLEVSSLKFNPGQNTVGQIPKKPFTRICIFNKALLKSAEKVFADAFPLIGEKDFEYDIVNKKSFLLNMVNNILKNKCYDMF